MPKRSREPAVADGVMVILCDHCAEVHIVMYRDGEVIGFGTPADVDAFAVDLALKIAESRDRKACMSPAKH